MKYINKIALFFALVFIFGSCEFDEKINVPSESPNQVPIQNLLPAGQAAMAFAIGGEMVRFNTILMQQLEGINAQQLDNTRYLIREADTDGVWDVLYQNTLYSVHVLINQANEQELPHYEGIGKVMMATGLGILTDSYGDIPYSEAFRAEEGIIAPKYDSQEEIYQSIQTLLDEAIALLEKPEVGVMPGSEDLYHQGDLDLWIKSAYALKARYYIHTSQVSGNSAYTNALAQLSKAMADNSEDYEMDFGTGSNEGNPQYRFSLDRSGNIKIADNFVTVLTSKNDPRAAAFLVGGTNNFTSGTFYTESTSPVVLASYAEMKFIEAEAKLMTGDAAGAQTALNQAVATSFSKFGVSSATYATTNARITGLNQEAALAVILNEKYVALYSQGLENWVDYRRKGYPNLTPVENGSNAFNTNGAIPLRLPYSQAERILNPNIPVKVPNLQTPMWWDR
jgi:hypothetical protein